MSHNGRLKIHLLVIDPQNDFCRNDQNFQGSLFVPGADEDMKRLARFVDRVKDKIDDIHITLDSHHKVDISHPIWFRDANGNHPGPFTLISSADLESGRWTTTMPSAFNRTLAYLKTLEGEGKYPHTIWPEHCLISSEGQAVFPELFHAVQKWESRYAMTDFVTKGSNPWTEHFSAVKANVPDPNDPGTQINTRLIRTLEEADVILLAGEALSHCLLSTVGDIADNFGNPAFVEKLVLLTDCSSMVPDPPGVPGLFSNATTKALNGLYRRGLKQATSDSFLLAA